MIDTSGLKTGLIPPQEALTYKGMELLEKIRSGELPYPPFIASLNMEITKIENRLTVFTMEPSIPFYNLLGGLHGGIIATLLDTAMACSIITLLSRGQSYTTLEFKVNFIRPVHEKTGPIHGEGKVLHIGHSTATAEGRLTDDRGKLYAFATTTCLIIHPTIENKHLENSG